MLELKLLGSPQILLNGQPVTGLSATKSQALLFALAVQGRPQSRLALAGLLWPDKPESDALANVRQALYHLRNALADYLLINRATVALNPALPCQIDVLLFEQECVPTNPLALRQTAVDRYAGDFLAGFYVENADPFEEWAVVMRERLHRLATTTFWEGQTQAAFAHYERCRQLLAEELGAEPSAETVALVEQIRRGEIEGKTRRQEDQKAEGQKTEASAPSIQNPKSKIQNQHDWGEMPDVRALWGRDGEVQQLEQWLVTEHQRIVTLVGMGGMGKTTLAATVVTRLAPQFTWVLWRSLLNAPPLSDILRDWVQALAGYTLATWPTLLDAQLALLFEQLRQQRCLLVLDNVESILSAPGSQPNGAYQPDYADYGHFFARLGESAHQSSLLLTSRELPPEVVRLERRGAPVRRLPLPGLPLAAGQHLLTDAGLIGSVAQQRELLTRYSGNPLALQLVGKTIQDFFAGAIAAFLSDETLLFDDVREMLDQQFARLTGLERELLLWLAIEREPVTLPMLQGALLYAGAKSAILDALLDLQQRSLLEKLPTGFTLQNVIMEYATTYLVDGVCHEIETATPHLLHSHALLRAQAKAYVRESQARLLLHPIGERLQKKLGTAGMGAQFKTLLDQVRHGDMARASYLGGNILNLLLHLGLDPSSYDFSQLAVWQADLRKADLPALNLAGADLRHTIFAQHFTGCHTLAFSPRGHLLAGGMANGEIHLWQTANRQLATVIKAHTTIIWDLVFSPDGQWLASGSKDGSVRLWDVETHQCRQTFTGHSDWVRTVAFHPTGRLLASGGHDQTVRLWDVNSGRTLHVLNKHTGWVMGLAFSPDGTRLVSASTDQTVRLWDVQTGQEQVVLRGHSACTESLCFSPDGSILATASYDQTICLWDLTTTVEAEAEADRYALLRVLRGHQGAVYGAAFSADGRRFFSAGHEALIYVWDVATGQRLYTLAGHKREVNALAVHPTDALLATSETGTSTICLWESEAKPTLTHIFYGYRNWANSVAFHPHLPLVASASPAEKAHLWDALTGQHLQSLHCENGMGASLAFGSRPNEDRAQLAFGSMDHSVWLWPIQYPASTIPSPHAAPLVLRTPDEVHSVAFSPDGRHVLAGSYDGVIHLWDAQTGQPLRQFMIAGDRRLKAVAMSADGDFIAAGSHNLTVALWQVATGAYRQLHGHTEWVWAVAFHPSGILASGSFDRTVRLWHVHSGEVQQVLSHDASIVQVLAFNRDGSLLAVGTGDAMIYLWDTRTLATAPTTPLPLLHKWQAHSEVIQGLAFSSEGQLLASASLDGTVKIWDVYTRQCRHTLQAPGPYAGMTISGVTGISEAQKIALKTLGAIDEAPTNSLSAAPSLAIAERRTIEPPMDKEDERLTDATLVLPAPALHNLPVQTTSFIGRTTELVELTQKLSHSDCRLMTLIGLGGIGKTRLAIELARQMIPIFPNGVYFVTLAAINDAAQIPQSITTALGLTVASDSDPLTRLLDYLKSRKLLLVLDNLEHLRDTPALIATFLQAAPMLTVLCTSRTRINLQVAWQIDITGLMLPNVPSLAAPLTDEAIASLSQVEAVQLFSERAQRARHSFAVDAQNLPAILRICHLVGGMPLALELAAGWVPLFSCQEIAEKLSQNLDALTTTANDVPDRQRSVQSVLETTWQQLDDATHYALMALAVFRGGIQQRATAVVAAVTVPMLTHLINHSLLRRLSPDRYELHELLRQFVYQKLTLLPTLWQKAATDHSHFFALFLAERRNLLSGDVAYKANEIEREFENIWVAWRHLLQNLADPAGQSEGAALHDLGLMVDGLYLFFDLHDRFREGVVWFSEAIVQLAQPALAQSKAATLLRGKLLSRAARFHYYLDQMEQTKQLAQQALPIATEYAQTSEVAFCWMQFANIATYTGDHPTAVQHFTHAHNLYKQCGDAEGIVAALNGLGVAQQSAGQLSQAHRYFQEAHQRVLHLDHAMLLSISLNNLGETHLNRGEYSQALACLREALQINQRLASHEGAAFALRNMAAILTYQGKLTEAHQHILRARALFGEMGHHRGVVFSLLQLAGIAQATQHFDEAEGALTEAEALIQRLQINQYAHMVTMEWARLRFAQNDWRQAQVLAQKVLNVCQASGIRDTAGQAQLLLGEIALLQHAWAEAATHFTAVAALALADEVPPLLLEAISGQARLLQQQNQVEPAVTLLFFIVAQSAVTDTVRRQAQQALAALQPLLAADAAQQAQQAAASMTLATAVTLAQDAISDRDRPPTDKKSVATVATTVPLPLSSSITLPAEVTSFVGREMESALVQQRLADPACRLLTITGMGGVGKTRLALRTAHLLADRLTNTQAPQFPDGIYYVPLAALEPHPQLEHLLATTIAAALGISLAGAATPTQQLLQALTEKDLLLILDNCEHLPVAAFINQLLQQTQTVKVLVTSRARLNVRGEQLIRLTGLTTPTALLPAQVTDDDLWRLHDHSAIRLFVQSVQAMLPDFTLDTTTAAPVVQICQLLHGLPLGLELAATWAQLLPLPEIVQEIRQNLDFLESAQLDAPAHQRSLRAVFNHSWQRLTTAEQHALRRLTVFTGGFTREAAAQVAGATLPLLAQLTDKSLVQRVDPTSKVAASVKTPPPNLPQTGGGTDTGATVPSPGWGGLGRGESLQVRYELQPVVRQYAAEALQQADETAAYQERHAAYMAQFLAAQRADLQAAKQQEALRAIDAEIENVRSAWQWLLAHLPTAQSGLAQLAEQVSQSLDSLFHFYDMRSWFQEGETIFGQLAQQLAAVIPPLTTPVAAHDPALALWRLQAKAQARQGWFACQLGRYTESRQLLTASLQRLQQLEAEADTLFNLNYLGALLRHTGEFAQATAYLQTALRLAEQHHDPMAMSIALNIRGQIALVQGELAAAQQFCQQALQIKRTLGDRWGMTFSLGYLGRAAQYGGDYAAAQKLFAECLTIARELGDQRGAAFALQCLGDTAYAASDLAAAQARYQESLALYRAISNHYESSVTLARLGETWRTAGNRTQAHQALRDALALAWSLPATPGLLAALLGLANLALDAGQDADALPPLRFVARHAASSQQQRQQATQLLAALGAAVTDDSTWDLTAYVQRMLHDGQATDVTTVTIQPVVAALPAPAAATGLVARSQELARLEAALTQMLAGRGQIYFVTGEAGSGKSALIRAFVQQSQASHPNLVVVGALCSAQNGIGDPYLPFRELLNQLAGTAGTTNGAGWLTPAATIKRLLPMVATALVARGADLIEHFVPGAALLAHAETVGNGDNEWLPRLRTCVAQAQTHAMPAVATSRVFAQYTAVLQQIAANAPLLLVLDDLQWADASSLSLLFHLLRNSEQSRIMLLGAYRPEEVTQSNGDPKQDGAHPLATLVHECKRSFGDVLVDLDRAIERAGRSFVDAFLDSEPNRLGERFRQALFAHTKGHPLFTIELLRDLQTREHLQRDAAGDWVEPTAIAWTSLPARVEGVIAARIDRLPVALRQLLQAASVEGEEFTAEVVARVQALSEREVVRRLEHEAERQHRLVVAQDNAPSVTPHVTRYRFRHNLFQHYIYHALGVGERRLLHKDVAEALRALYGRDDNAITVALARHLAEAGENERAAAYAIRAGDSSARAFAFAEARLHYEQALKLLATLAATVAVCRLRIDITCRYADAALSFAPSAQVVAQIKAAEPLLALLPVPLDQADRTRRAWLQRWLGHFARLRNETATAFAYLEPLLAEAQALGNDALGADVAGILGWIYLFLGRFAEAEPLLQQTLAFREKEGNQREWAQSANDCGVVIAHRGRCAEGIALVQRCLQIAQAANDAEAIATNHFYLAWLYLIVGDYAQAFAQLHLVLAVEAEAGQVGLADVVAMFQGWLHGRQGEVALAQAALARMQSQDNYLYSVVYPIIQLELVLLSGQPDQTVALAHQTLAAITANGDRWGEGCVQRLWALALATSSPTLWTEVDQHFAESLRAFAAGGARLEAARTQVAWGKTLVQRDALQLGVTHFDQAAAQFASSGLTQELAEVRTLLAGLTANSDGSSTE
ncbi:MAG: hypothetical protein DYG89_36110 [Caldilinea sp. CFX5]|nr:hypothetical protein [Caldilinea sp. CFX5]